MNTVSKTRTLIMQYTSSIRKTSEYWTLITAALPLAGCMGIYEGGFECPAGVGVGCKSISEVNTMVDQDELPKNSPNHLIQAKPEIWYAPAMRKMETTDPKMTDRPSLIEVKNLREDKVNDVPKSI